MELSVAMVLLALVAVLATSVAMLVGRSQNSYSLDAAERSQAMTCESVLKSWLMQYDKVDCTITVSDQRVSVAPNDYMEFTEGKLVCTAEQTGGDGYAKTQELGEVEEITFACADNVISCTVCFKQSAYAHKILYTMRAAKVEAATE